MDRTSAKGHFKPLYLSTTFKRLVSKCVLFGGSLCSSAPSYVLTVLPPHSLLIPPVDLLFQVLQDPLVKATPILHQHIKTRREEGVRRCQSLQRTSAGSFTQERYLKGQIFIQILCAFFNFYAVVSRVAVRGVVRSVTWMTASCVDHVN